MDIQYLIMLDRSITIRNAIASEELDYVLLSRLLSNYSNPRDKISRLLKDGTLIRVKKGLYVFDREWSRSPYSCETLANLIYGPSYISLDYALFYYGVIPERVQVITSVTIKRSKSFETPVGNFTYQHLSQDKYQLGVQQLILDPLHPILIASLEKALVDKLTLGINNLKLKSTVELKKLLVDDLRMDFISSVQNRINLEKLKEITKHYKNNTLDLLVDLFEIGALGQ